MLGEIRAYLCVKDAEGDPGFAREMRVLARRGVRLISAIETIVPPLLLLAQFALLPDRSTWGLRAGNTLGLIGVGLLTFAAARLKPRAVPDRLVGCLSGWAAAASLMTFSLLLSGQGEATAHYIPGHITTVLLVAVGTLPLRPLQTLSLGLSMGAFHLLAGYTAMAWGIVEAVDPDRVQVLFILMATFLSTALSALLYRERLANYRSHQETLRTSDVLCKTQSRLLLAENAASMGRLAAAVSHELNSPIGALRSAVDSLVLVAAKQATSPKDDHGRLVLLQADLRRTITESSERLRQTVARLQRFTNLDKSEVSRADINAMIADVIALLEPGKQSKVKLELDLQPMPPLFCRPQQLSAVFSSLLHNAIDAISNGDGRVQITTRDLDSLMEVRIRDNGRGLKPDEIGSIFEPTFKVAGARVGTGNWSLFSARQIIREHGGEISIESPEGRGTLVKVRLPRLAESALD